MNKAIFWDLLGTLGGNSKTLIQDFQFFDEAIPALKLATENKFLNIIITNQSHIAHGRLTMQEFNEGAEKIIHKAEKQGATIEKIYVCPHQRADNCSCKKPKPELIFQAANEFMIDLEKSFVVGDTVRNDIGLAQAVGAKGILVLTGGGHDSMEKEQEKQNRTEPDFIAANVLDAVKKIGRIVLESKEIEK